MCIRDRIGIIGSTGSGKTTLVNIIANLVEVSEGKVLLNNDDVEKNVRAFQKNIGYISPDTFLVDKSILFNITFKNNDKVNHNELMKIIEVFKLEQIEFKPDEGSGFSQKLLTNIKNNQSTVGGPSTSMDDGLPDFE